MRNHQKAFPNLLEHSECLGDACFLAWRVNRWALLIIITYYYYLLTWTIWSASHLRENRASPGIIITLNGSRARPKSTRLPSILSDLTNGEMPFDSFSWDNLVARNDSDWCGRFRLELLFPNLGSKSSFWGKDDRETRPNSACEYCQDTSPGRVPVGHSSYLCGIFKSLVNPGI